MSTMFENRRPEDLRHDYPHAVAEMVQDLQKVAADVTAAQDRSLKILSGSVALANETIIHLDEAKEQLKTVIQDSQSTFTEVVAEKQEDLISIISEAINVLRKDAADSAQRMNDATEASVKAAAEAEEARAKASDARMQMNDYRAELDKYRVSVEKACKDAIAKAIAGPTVFERLYAVFRPAKVTVLARRVPPHPIQPSK